MRTTKPPPTSSPWTTKTLGSIVSLQRGHDLPDSRRRHGEVPVMSAAGHNGFHDTAIVWAPGIVVGRSGAAIGQVHYCSVDFWPHNTALYVTNFHGNDPVFTFYFLQSLGLSRYNSGGAQPSLNRNFIYPLSVTVPEAPEQRAIAGALSDVDGLIGALDKLIAKKRAIKQGTMQQLLTGTTRLPGFSGKWEIRRLGDVSKSDSGGTPPSTVARYYAGGIPWVSIADMTDIGKWVYRTERTLSHEGLAASTAKLWLPGTVLYAMYASIGECSMAAVELCSSQAILGIQPQPGLHTEYLYYQLVWRRDRVKAMAQHGTQPNLNAEIVRGFKIPLPSLDEQVGIGGTLSDMDDEIAALERRRDKTKAIKEGMMQALLTGRVRLVDPEASQEATA